MHYGKWCIVLLVGDCGGKAKAKACLDFPVRFYWRNPVFIFGEYLQGSPHAVYNLGGPRGRRLACFKR